MSTENDFSLLPPLPETPVQSLSPTQANTRFQIVFPIVLKILKVVGKMLLGIIYFFIMIMPEKNEKKPSIGDIMSGEQIPGSNKYMPIDPPQQIKHH